MEKIILLSLTFQLHVKSIKLSTLGVRQKMGRWSEG